MRSLSVGLKEGLTDPDTGQKTSGFKMDLDSLTNLLCFNNKREAQTFLQTELFRTVKSPETGIVEVIKGDLKPKIWMPTTNYKYIEAKKLEGKKIHSRCDIIMGISCRIDNSVLPKFASATESIAQPDPAIQEARRKAEQERKNREIEARKALEREALQKELKERMEAEKEMEEIRKREEVRLKKERLELIRLKKVHISVLSQSLKYRLKNKKN